MSNKKVYVVGVGMTNFVKGGTGPDYPELGKEAVKKALEDAGIKYDKVQQAVCGYVYGDSTSGQRVLYEVGMTGIPIYNTNNSGSTGASALFLAKQLVEGLICDVALVVGFEKMSPGPLDMHYKDRANPMDRHIYKLAELTHITSDPMTAQLFGSAAIEHMKKYGTTERQFAKIAAKNHKHSVKNPQAQSKREYTIEEILESRRIYGPLTLLQCCPTTDGASAAILMSERAVIARGLQDKAVEIVGMEMATDTAAVYTQNSFMKLAGYDMTVLAAQKLYKNTGISPKEVNIVELHDCFSSNELIAYEALQLCGEGEGGIFVDAGDNTYGGKVVVNPSGGCIGKGHPLAASGLAQTAELVWQLRGDAGERQVLNPKFALQHTLGLGGSVVVGLYRKGFNKSEQNQSTTLEYPEDFKASTYVRLIESVLKNLDDTVLENIKGKYQLTVIKNEPNRSEANWIFNTDDRSIQYGGNTKPDVTFTLSDDDFDDVFSGKVEAQKAYLYRKVKVQGDMKRVVKLMNTFKIVTKNIGGLRAKF